jgi:hypothetical protein
VDSVATGGVQYLLQFPDITELLGSFPADDPNPANAGQPWLFADANQGVLARVESTGQSAVVLGDAGGWQAPPQLGTQRFRRLRIDVWTDPQRDQLNNIIETSIYTSNRCLDVFTAIHHRLQRTDPDAVMFGNMVTLACTLLTEASPVPMVDGDNMLRGTAFYGILFSGWLG